MSDDLTPQWGVNILIAIERLDAKVSSNEERHTAHATWAERNIKDLELRMRSQEAANDPQMANRVTKLESFRYALMGGAMTVGTIASLLTNYLTNA